MIELGVNIDHVATLRQARGTIYPDPIEAAQMCIRDRINRAMPNEDIQSNDQLLLETFCNRLGYYFSQMCIRDSSQSGIIERG